jgi:hypothetical protein
MTEQSGSKANDLLAAWERSTDRPIPPFSVPAGRRPWATGVLGLTGVLILGLVGWVAVGALTSPRPVGPSLEAALASLADLRAARFQLRVEIMDPSDPGSCLRSSCPPTLHGLTGDGTASFTKAALTASAQSLSPDGVIFGEVGSGDVTFVDGRFFARHGNGPWGEVKPDASGGDGPASVFARLLDVPRLSNALLSIPAAYDHVSSDKVPCGATTCTRHRLIYERSVMLALVEAMTGLSLDPPPDTVDPLVTTIVVDPAGRIVSVDGGFTQADSSIRVHLDLEPLDEAPPIAPPIP